MKHFLSSLLLLSSLFSFAQDKKLIWEENFNGSELNTTIWNYELGDGCPSICGWGNNEKQIYTNSNHTVSNGMLTIEIKKKMKTIRQLVSLQLKERISVRSNRSKSENTCRKRNLACLLDVGIQY